MFVFPVCFPFFSNLFFFVVVIFHTTHSQQSHSASSGRRRRGCALHVALLQLPLTTGLPLVPCWRSRNLIIIQRLPGGRARERKREGEIASRARRSRRSPVSEVVWSFCSSVSFGPTQLSVVSLLSASVLLSLVVTLVTRRPSVLVFFSVSVCL